MIHSISPDLEQAVQVFFSDYFLPPRETQPYRIGMAEIKKEFRKKALLFHPDRAAVLGESKDLLEEKFKEINDAYGILKSALADDYLILGPGRPSKRHAPDFRGGYPFGTAASQRPYARESTGFRAAGYTAAASRPNRKSRPPFFYKGRIPQRRLRFGEFLFYKQVIAWQTLMEAITWQHQVRPKIGKIAIELNYLEPVDILTVLRNRTFKEPFGAAAVRLGLIDEFRRIVLLGHQRRLNLPLGRFFLNAGILDQISLARFIQENQAHNFYSEL